jgi:hypothetical protein
MKYQKFVRDDMVGVVFSSDYGTGWSTQCDEDKREAACMDADIVKAVLARKWDTAARLGEERYDVCTPTNRIDRLAVAWVVIGERFEINEYDGLERLHVIGSRKYMTA